MLNDPEYTQSNNGWAFQYGNSNYADAVEEAGTIKVLDPYARDKSGIHYATLAPCSIPYNWIGRSVSRAVSSDRDIGQGGYPHRYYPIPYIPQMATQRFKISVY